jgi:glycosyltransferase involved in cell wall biosynthesis
MTIVTISDSPTIFSGLARVHGHVIDALIEQGHSVVPCGWFAYDSDQMSRIKEGKDVDKVFYKSTKGPIRVLAVPKSGKMNETLAAYDIVDMIKPDIVITIGDPWNFFYMRAVKIKTGFNFKWIPYLTVEDDNDKEKWEPLLRYADMVLVPTEYGKKVIESCCNVETRLLPYGVDEVFRPYSDDDVRGLRSLRGCEGKVRFITVAQNTWRKNFPALLQAVFQIKRCGFSKNMTFHLHTNVDATDRQEGYLYDLRAVVSKLDIEDMVTFPEGKETFSVFKSPDDYYLSKEYNASDFLVCPSTSEGYCLPICEGMSCGLPVIANSASVMPEHLGASVGEIGEVRRGFLVDSMQQILPPARIASVINPRSLRDCIIQAYRMTTSLEGCTKLKTWRAAKKGLCGAVNRLTGKPKVVVEEF